MAHSTPCPSCGNPIDSAQKSCLKCGYKKPVSGVMLAVIGILFLVGVIYLYGTKSNSSKNNRQAAVVSQTETSESRAKAARFRDLRNEGIRNIGWVAGNSKGHPIWPEIKPYVTAGGEYYEFFMRLAPPGSDHKVEAIMNVNLYRAALEDGQKLPFNEMQNILRIKRAITIGPQILEIYK